MKSLSAIFILILFSQTTWSQVLLLPDSNITFEKYHEDCKKDGYACTMPYLLARIQSAPTTLFDAFLEKLDYSSEKFRDEIPNQLLSLLKDEMISIDQAEILLKVLEQTKELSAHPKPIELIEKQLREWIQMVKANQLDELPEKYLILFKVAVPLDFNKKIKPYQFKIKSVESRFDQVPDENDFLVTGSCDQIQIHPFMTEKKWQIDSDTSCGFTDHFSKMTASTGHFMAENKNTLIITGLVVLGAVLLSNNYEVQFSF